jgi:hypothetical protein
MATKKMHRTMPALAAGVVASGGALAAGKLVHDQGAERAQRRRARYRLRPDEGASEGIRRVARGQLELASNRLTDSGRKEIGEAIHEARKSLKRLRAVVRLARDPLGDDTYRHENRTFRDAGRKLSDVRDAQVIRAGFSAHLPSWPPRYGRPARTRAASTPGCQGVAKRA